MIIITILLISFEGYYKKTKCGQVYVRLYVVVTLYGF
jgi:hypothetical protein